MSYDDFVAGKLSRVPPTGLTALPELNATLFPHQRDLVTWALRRGRCAVFADTGLGKSAVQLEWARCVALATGGRVLILAPLAVGSQTVREAERMGIAAKQVKYASDIDAEDCPQIVITNYDRVHHFEDAVASGAFVAVVCDESSVIKNSSSKTFETLTAMFAHVAFRLCATATPSPNDYTELGTHAEFLGICTKEEMLAEYFCHDGGETQTWRLKGHARTAFWRWVAGWAALIRKPSDFGYDDSGYILPPLVMHQHTIPADHSLATENEVGQSLLFADPARTLTQRRAARKNSMNDRVAGLVKLVTEECESCARKRTSTLTLAHTTSPTRTSGFETSHQESSAMPSEERGMQTTSRTATSSKRKSKNSTYESRNSSKVSVSESTGSLSPTLNGCSLPREDAAPSVLASETWTPDGIVDSTLTTATSLAVSEACSAPHAILVSASLETARNDSRWPQDICDCAKSKQWLVWVELNAEEDAITDALGCEAIAIRGSATSEEKEAGAMAWMRGDVRILVSKASIFGFGLNFQHCARMCFVGVKDSYESTYQAIRRSWRFGQKREVHVHVFASELEGEVVKNLERKERDALAMADALSLETNAVIREEITGQKRQTNSYEAKAAASLPDWMTQ